jgi:hypothetical protein
LGKPTLKSFEVVTISQLKSNFHEPINCYYLISLTRTLTRGFDNVTLNGEMIDAFIYSFVA